MIYTKPREYVKIGDIWHKLVDTNWHETVCGLHVSWFLPTRADIEKVNAVCVAKDIPDLACAKCAVGENNGSPNTL